MENLPKEEEEREEEETVGSAEMEEFQKQMGAIKQLLLNVSSSVSAIGGRERW